MSKARTLRRACLLVALACTVVSGAGCEDREKPPEPAGGWWQGALPRLEPEFQLGGEAPDFELRRVPGISSLESETELGRLSDLTGSVVLIDFWGAWCGGCIREHPMLVELAKEYGERGVRFFGVTSDSPEEVSQFIASRGEFSYPLLTDPGGVAALYQVVGWPTKVIVDRVGRVMWWRPGGPLPRDLVAAALDDVLAGRRPDPGLRAGFPAEPAPEG